MLIGFWLALAYLVMVYGSSYLAAGASWWLLEGCWCLILVAGSLLADRLLPCWFILGSCWCLAGSELPEDACLLVGWDFIWHLFS
jgi:hypothetical protein